MDTAYCEEIFVRFNSQMETEWAELERLKALTSDLQTMLQAAS